MGQKTHPIGFRLGIIRDWQSRWFAKKTAEYRELVLEDMAIRRAIFDKYPDAGISRVEIERGNNDLVITIHTARPGIVIGRQGGRVDEMRRTLEKLLKERRGLDKEAKVPIRLNVQEVRQPELDAYLVARSVADQLSRRVAFRRAMRLAVSRTMQAGARGIKIICSGRLGGAEIARSEKVMEGRVPLHTLRADIDYGQAEAHTEMGRIGVKVWIYRGDIMPVTQEPEGEEEEITPIEVTLKADEEATSDASTPPSEISETAEREA